MSVFPDSLTTEFLLDADIDLAPTQQIGATPLGTRSIYNVAGGTFEGPNLRGTFLPGGADWLLTLANGASELDVRATMQTDDGALIYITYRDVIDIAPDVAPRVFGGDTVDTSEYYFRTTPDSKQAARNTHGSTRRYAWESDARRAATCATVSSW